MNNVVNVEKNKVSKNEQEKTWPQIYAVLISTMAGIANGQFYAWASPFMVQIINDKVNYNITEEQASYFNTINPIFTVLMCPFCSKLTDNLGRKKTILLIAVPQISSWVCAALATDVYLFYVSRAFAGIADAIFFAALPPYVGEITTPAVRGKWGNLLAGSYYIGEFSINVIGSYFGVVTSSYICLPLPVIFFILFSMIPESPYYYLIKGNEEEAKKSLIYFRGDKNIDQYLDQLKHDVQRQMSESGTWGDLFKIKSNRKALLAAVFLRFTQHTSGLGILITFTQFIFQKSGGNLSHELSSIIYTGVQMTLNFIVLTFIMQRFGRRGCYMTSTGGNGIVLFFMATYFYLNDYTNIDVSTFNWFPVASTVVFQMFASFGLNVIPTLMLSELFSVSIKTKAMVLVVLMFGAGGALINYLFYLINTSVGFFAPFYLFAFCNILTAIITYFILPETRDKTLEDIQQALKNKKIY
ncbi:facilitated trehalose transporter Tret1-like [Diabrotica undecimpunctata]|uniref:facilitated trehalose transporter Tret1-like n=1 Tax=Diabrotica undecimpunctata TaxID=50387 RepID=UPI003B63E4F7